MTGTYETSVSRRQSPLYDALPWTFLVQVDGETVLAGMAPDEVEAREAAAMLVAMLQIKRGDA